ncbi:YadA-like family protein [Acinetobacter sp.]|uniref:YadA-like family protein n=1 Tax=Acinetobacter sp. TaxID=472 RepID=UPI0039823DA2
MNKVYKIVWNESLGTWCAISEVSKTRGKRSSAKTNVAGALLAVSALTMSGMTAAADNYVSVNDGGTQSGNYNNDGAVASGSVVIGPDSSSIGASGVAIGNNADVTGLQGVAIGNNAQAGYQSIALGFDTVATAFNSMALGNRAIAYTDGTTLGQGTYANKLATAMGNGALAVGQESTAYGYSALAGTDSFSQPSAGTDPDTIGKAYATAMGSRAKASAQGSTAVGAGSVAEVDNGIALGANSVANTGAGVAGYVPTSANQSQKDAINATQSTLGAVSVGSVGNTRQITNVAAGTTDTDAVNVAQLKAVQSATETHYFSVNDEGTQANNYNNDGATGKNALAVGIGAKAVGENAIAIGNVTSDAANSIAIGNNNSLSNSASSSTAIGHNNNVTGNEAIALGANNTVKDFSGVAVGSYNNAEGYRSIAVGAENKTKGQWSSAFGVWNIAEGERATVLGANNTIQGRRALGIGVANEISSASEYSSAVGAFNKIIDSMKSLTAGFGNTVTGGEKNSVLGNENTLNNAKNTTVLGNKNTVAQENTQVLGNNVITTQANSVVLGNESTDRAATTIDKVTINGEDYAFAGVGSAANGVVSVGKVGGERQIINVAAGEVSASSTDAINGSQLYATNKAIADSQTHYVSINDGGTQTGNYNNDGAKGKNSLAVGINATAFGENSVAVGSNNISNGNNTATLGSNNKATSGNYTNSYSVALGVLNESDNGTAVGYNNKAGMGDVALGANNVSTGGDSIAVGYYNSSLGNQSLSVGMYNNVTDGQSFATGFGNRIENSAAVGGYTGSYNVISGMYNSISEGSRNSVLGSNNTLKDIKDTSILGSNVTVTQDNSVILGNESTDRAATSESKVTILGQDYAFAGVGSASNGVVSVGKVGAERQIINVAAGQLSATSTDAVNGSQLYATNQAITEVGKSAATAKTEVVEGDNIVVTETQGKNGQSIYNVATAKEVSFDKTTVGTVITDSATGKITGLTAGEVSETSTDAINGSQLYATNKAIADSKTHYVSVNDDGVQADNYNNDGATGKNALAVGVGSKAAGENAVVIGYNNNVAQDKTVALGSSITTTQANSVVLGNASTDRVATVVDKVSINGEDYAFAGVGSTANGVVSVGKVGGERQIINVAAGEISASSTDAINGSQLHATNQAVEKLYAGAGDTTHYVSINDAGNKAGNYNNDGASGALAVAVGVGASAKGDGATALGLNSSAKSKDAVAIGTDTRAELEGSVALGKGSVANTAAGIAGFDPLTGFGSSNTGSTWRSSAAAFSVGDVSRGITRQITGVAAGTADTDAVNVAQLKAAMSKANEAKGSTETVSAGKNTEVTKTTKADGSTDYQVATKDDVSFDSVTVGNIKADSQNNTISGLADGKVSADSDQAIKGSQLHDTAESVANALGGNAKVNPDGTIKTSNIGNTGKDNVHDAIASIHGQVAGAKTSVSAGKNTVVNSSTNADGSNNYQVALAEDIQLNSVTANQVTAQQVTANKVSVGKVTIDGTTNKVSGLANGEISSSSTDAINGSQLHQTNSSVAQHLGGGSTLNKDGSIGAPTYNVAGGTFHNVGDALGAIDTRVSNLEQAFYDTNKNMDDLRNDTYAGIAGAMAVGNLPQPTEAGMSMVSAGVSGYRGETAVAIGVSAITDSNKIVWKMGASADSRSNIGGAVSMGYQWK